MAYTKKTTKSAKGKGAYKKPAYTPRGDAKYVDVANSIYGNSTTGSITHLDIVAQGNTINQREGKAFHPTSVQIRGQITTGNDTTTCQYANYLVWDYQPNKALASITDVLDSAHSSSYANRENMGRFKIIRTIRGVLSGQNDDATNGYNNVVDINEYIKLQPDMVAMCQGTTSDGVIAHRISGALLFVTVGNQAVGSTAANTTCGFRINFVE